MGSSLTAFPPSASDLSHSDLADLDAYDHRDLWICSFSLDGVLSASLNFGFHEIPNLAQTYEIVVKQSWEAVRIVANTKDSINPNALNAIQLYKNKSVAHTSSFTGMSPEIDDATVSVSYAAGDSFRLRFAYNFTPDPDTLVAFLHLRRVI